jgi:putative transposase
VLCAVGVDAEGGEHVLGLREGATENAVVASALLEDLVGRGLDPKRRRLFVIDGSKALRKAIGLVFGDGVPVQRCRNHTIRAQSQNGGPRSSFPLPALPRIPGLASKSV